MSAGLTAAPVGLGVGQRPDGIGRPAAELGRRLGVDAVELGRDNVIGTQSAVSAARKAVRVHVSAQAVLVGPFGGDPDRKQACGNCLAIRWQRLRTRSERNALESGAEAGWDPVPRPRGAQVTPHSSWPVVTDYLVDTVRAVHEMVGAGVPGTGDRSEWVTGDADAALAKVWRIDVETLAVNTFPILPEPLCPVCGDHDVDSATPWQLQSRPLPSAGAARLCSPMDYPLPTGALANPVCGALGATTGWDLGSPTTSAVGGSIFMRGYAGLNDIAWSGQANSFAGSRRLAFLEGLERYAGTHRRRRSDLVVGSYDELAADALDPRSCGLYSDNTYRTDPFIEPFDSSRPMRWVWGHSLRDNRPLLVPARMVYYSAGMQSDNFVLECSNGCAIGSCLEEAVLFGLLELMERDAFLLAWYGRATLPEIDLTSFDSGAVRSMVDRAGLLGYDIRAFDTRIDLGVPVVTGMAVRQDGGDGLLSFAAGAALDPARAVEGALSEVLTYLPHLRGQVLERRAEIEQMALDPYQVRHIGDHAQLFGLPEMAVQADEYLRPRERRSMEDLYSGWNSSRPRTGDLLDDLAVCRDQLVGAGFDVIAVDQTTPEQEQMGLSSVTTFAPGLVPIDFGWNRQRVLHSPRLRTAFRQAGWRGTDLADDEIKKVPHPFP